MIRVVDRRRGVERRVSGVVAVRTSVQIAELIRSVLMAERAKTAAAATFPTPAAVEASVVVLVASRPSDTMRASKSDFSAGKMSTSTRYAAKATAVASFAKVASAAGRRATAPRVESAVRS